MPKTPKKKRPYKAGYAADGLTRAVEAVNGGMSFGKASAAFNVPKTTIIDHVKGRIKEGAQPGRKPNLAEDVEDMIVKKVLDTAKAGYQHTTQSVMNRFKFSEEQDILLLKEAVAVRAFDCLQGGGWKVVAANLLNSELFWPTLSARSVRERTNLLLDRYVKWKRESEASSGVEEAALSEKEILLEELHILKQEVFERERAVNISSKSERKVIRQQAMKGMCLPVVVEDSACSSSSSTTPSLEGGGESFFSPPQLKWGTQRLRGIDPDLLRYLQEKEKNRANERKEELALRREELNILREEKNALLQVLTKLLLPQSDVS